MRILVTGGAGCLGSNLTERWIAAGVDVLVLDNFATGHRDNLPARHEHLEIRTGTIADKAFVERAFEEFRPSHVVHCAASYKDPNDWAEDVRTNVEGAGHVVRAAVHSGVGRFINFQTALAYGHPDAVPIPASAPLRPFTSYGITKAAGEQYLAMSGLSQITLRLANVTGPRLAIGPIPTFYKRLKAGLPCFCSRTTRDFLDMDDFFAIVDLALADDGPQGAFNVSTGTGHTIREVYDLVAAHLGVAIPAPPAEVDPGLDDVPAIVLDPSETTAAFGWRATHQFEDVVRRVLAWYDLHGVSAIFSHLRPPP